MHKYLFGVVLALVATPGLAQETRAVRYGDLDLRTEAGVRALDRRLASAIERVCTNENRPLAMAMASRRCRAETSGRVDEQRATVIALARSGEQFASLEKAK